MGSKQQHFLFCLSLKTSFCWEFNLGYQNWITLPSLYPWHRDSNLWFWHIKSDLLVPSLFAMHDITSERFERNLEIPFSNMEVKTWLLAFLDMVWRRPERYIIYTFYLSNRLLISAISRQACRIFKPVYCGSGERKKGPFCSVRLSLS